MKNNIFIRFAAVIAVVIGILPIITGIKVLIGSSVPDYTVLTWLVIYNVSIGAISVITGILLWINHKLSKSLSAFIAIVHISILMLLLTVFNEIVASKSIKVMVIRAITWIIIFIVVSKNKNSTSTLA